MIAQGHVETPAHPSRPSHRPAVHKPSRPERPRHERPKHEGHRPDRGKEVRRGRGDKRTQKSAPEQERTLPIGGGARAPIPSLGALPTITRRH